MLKIVTAEGCDFFFNVFDRLKNDYIIIMTIILKTIYRYSKTTQSKSQTFPIFFI